MGLLLLFSYFVGKNASFVIKGNPSSFYSSTYPLL